jgi:acyl-CoA thioesterase-1
MVHLKPLRCLFAGCCAVLLGMTAAQAQIRIVAIGDSHIEGKGLPSADTFPGQLERALKAKGHDVVVANAGVFGASTYGILVRLDRATPAGTQIAIVNGGGNDAWSGVSRATIAANLRLIAERLQRRSIVVLMFAPPRPPEGGWKIDGVTMLPSFQEGIAEDTKYHLESRPAEGGPPGVYRWHLTADGYAIVVQRVLPAVEQAIAKVKEGS